MTYLIDADVLSEPTKARPDSKVVAWLTAHEGDFVVDSIVLGELSFGILALPKGRKRVQLEEWFNAVVSAIECLPWDAAVSLRWAGLLVELKRKGVTLPVLDTMIAATALERNLTFVTRNVRDFKGTGVKVLNPSS
jgi:predicted nucleic acid-binding protein